MKELEFEEIEVGNLLTMSQYYTQISLYKSDTLFKEWVSIAILSRAHKFMVIKKIPSRAHFGVSGVSGELDFHDYLQIIICGTEKIGCVTFYKKAFCLVRDPAFAEKQQNGIL